MKLRSKTTTQCDQEKLNGKKMFQYANQIVCVRACDIVLFFHVIFVSLFSHWGNAIYTWYQAKNWSNRPSRPPFGSEYVIFIRTDITELNSYLIRIECCECYYHKNWLACLEKLKIFRPRWNGELVHTTANTCKLQCVPTLNTFIIHCLSTACEPVIWCL